MLNTKEIESYYSTTNYNEEMRGRGPEAFAKWAKPDHKLEALNFKTREEYLQWVNEWKAAYKALSLHIRGCKSARKLQAHPYQDLSQWAARNEAFKGKAMANALLFARKEGRAYSQELKQERLKQAS